MKKYFLFYLIYAMNLTELQRTNVLVMMDTLEMDLYAHLNATATTSQNCVIQTLIVYQL